MTRSDWYLVIGTVVFLLLYCAFMAFVVFPPPAISAPLPGSGTLHPATQRRQDRVGQPPRARPPQDVEVAAGDGPVRALDRDAERPRPFDTGGVGHRSGVVDMDRRQ
jgi:hypothetical protein